MTDDTTTWIVLSGKRVQGSIMQLTADSEPSDDLPIVGDGSAENPWRFQTEYTVGWGLVQARLYSLTYRSMQQAMQHGERIAGIGIEADPWRFEKIDDPMAPLSPEEEEEIGMPAEEYIPEAEPETAKDVEPENDGAEPGPPMNPARLLVIGSSAWDVPETVIGAVNRWRDRHRVDHLTIITTGCPTGAEAAVKSVHWVAGFEVVRNEDLHRAGANAALFFIRDYSEGCENLLSDVLTMRLPVTVYREEAVVDNSPWQNH